MTALVQTKGHTQVPMEELSIVGYATLNSTLHLLATYWIIDAAVLNEDHQV